MEYSSNPLFKPNLFKTLVDQEGPRLRDYQRLDQYFRDAYLQFRYIGEPLYPQFPKKSIRTISCSLVELLSKDHLRNTIHGHALRKPHGYAGDFEIMDKVYTRWVHPNPKYGRWDAFFHYTGAVQAGRYRKHFFKELLQDYRYSGECQVLNLASGPGRDLYEYFTEHDHEQIFIDCIDMDQRAISYARNLNEPFRDHLSFIPKNVLLFKPDKQYDLIWSAGLFDYFSDRLFIRMLKKNSKLGKAGGRNRHRQFFQQ